MLSSPPPILPRVIAGVAIVAAVVWWQWPTIDRQDSRTDVVVLADGFLTSTETPITQRIHEDGRTMRWADGPTSWCSAADSVRQVTQQFDPAAIVLSFGDSTGCDASAVTAAVAAAGGHRVLIVSQPGRSDVEASADLRGATVIDPTRFIGDRLTATSMPCQWWETCTADGTVAVRTEDGSLTIEGSERVARIIVAELP